jgi:hypothetical protein
LQKSFTFYILAHDFFPKQKGNIHIYLFWYFGAQIAARAAICENEQKHQSHTSTTHQTTAVLQLKHHKTHKLMHTK